MLAHTLSLCLAVIPLFTAVDGASDFTASLAQVQKSLDAHRGKEAKSQLAAALVAHKDQPYARAQLAEVRRLTAACAFEVASPRRTVQDVFCGKVASYDAKSGKIVLRWEKPKETKAKGDKSDAPKPVFPCEDFEETDWGTVLRVPFLGPHSIELSGKAIGQDVPCLRACITDEFCYEARLDAGELQAIHRVKGEDRKSLASTSSIYNVMRPYKLEFLVRDTQLEAKHNGSRLVIADKPKGSPGRVGFRDVLDPLLIEASGEVDTAWIDAELVKLLAKDQAEFDARYDVNVDLPDWLRTP